MISKPARKNRSAHRPISTCRDEVSLISDYLTNNLSRSERLAFENHLSACRDCGAFLATYKKTIELSRSFLRGHLPNQPPLHLHATAVAFDPAARSIDLQLFSAPASSKKS